jgi:hypothetical protein
MAATPMNGRTDARTSFAGQSRRSPSLASGLRAVLDDTATMDVAGRFEWIAKPGEGCPRPVGRYREEERRYELREHLVRVRLAPRLDSALDLVRRERIGAFDE